jgi:hypothetical protein
MSISNKQLKFNEQLESFYNKQSFLFKQKFSLFIDEDYKKAIVHRVYNYIRIHFSKIESNPDFYIRIRYSVVNKISTRQKLNNLVSKGWLREPQADFHKDHTFYLNGTARIKEDKVIPMVDFLIEFTN